MVIELSETHLWHALGASALHVLLVDFKYLLQALALGLARGPLPERIVLEAQRFPVAALALQRSLAVAQISGVLPILVPVAQAVVVERRKAARNAQRQMIRAAVVAQEIAVPARMRA